MQPQQSKPSRIRLAAGFSSDELDLLLQPAQPKEKEPTTPHPATESPTPPAAAPIAQAAAATFETPANLSGLFKLYSDLEAKIDALVTEARRVEHELFGSDWKTVIEAPKMKDPHDIARLGVSHLINQAAARYAPPGATLSIDRYDILEAAGLSEWENDYTRGRNDDRSIPVDLDKLRAQLEAQYAGDAGETAAYRQQARVLIDFFGFERDGEMVTTARHVACTVRLWSTKKDYGVDKGKFEIHYNRHEDLRKVFHALASVFARAEQYDLSSALRRSPLTGYGFTFASRHRESYPGLDITLYSEKWVWQWSHEAAAALKVFLGEYGA